MYLCSIWLIYRYISANSSTASGFYIDVPSQNYIWSETFDFTPKYVSLFTFSSSAGRYAATYCTDFSTNKIMVYRGTDTGAGEDSNRGSNLTGNFQLGVSGNTVYVYMRSDFKRPACLIVSP